MSSPTRVRAAAIKATSFLYKRKFSQVHWCVYCGDPADTLDHVFPVSHAAAIDWSKMDPRVRRHLQPLLVMVPCCEPCNSLIRDFIPDSLLHKRREIQKRLSRKMQRFPRWSLDELNDLGPTLRSKVERDLCIRDSIEARKNWPRSRFKRLSISA